MHFGSTIDLWGPLHCSDTEVVIKHDAADQ